MTITGEGGLHRVHDDTAIDNPRILSCMIESEFSDTLELGDFKDLGKNYLIAGVQEIISRLRDEMDENDFARMMQTPVTGLW